MAQSVVWVNLQDLIDDQFGSLLTLFHQQARSALKRKLDLRALRHRRDEIFDAAWNRERCEFLFLPGEEDEYRELLRRIREIHEQPPGD